MMHAVLRVIALGLVVQTCLVTAFGELKGTHLYACVAAEKPYVVASPNRPATGNFDGIAIEVAELLRDNLGFTIEFHLWNHSFTQFFDEMEFCAKNDSAPPGWKSKEGCKCDIGVSSFTVTNERSERVDFVHPFGNDAHRAIALAANGREKGEYSFFVRTFTPAVWGMLVALFAVHAVGTFALFDGGRYEESSRHNKAWSRMRRFIASIQFSYTHLILHPFDRAHGHPKSLLRTSWTLVSLTLGLVLFTFYGASLTFLLFETQKSFSFTSIDDVKECRVPPGRVAFARNAAPQDYWEKVVNIPGSCVDVSDGSDGLPTEGLFAGLDMLRNHTADYFFSLEGAVSSVINQHCDEFVAVGEQFFQTAVAFVLPKNSSHLEALSRETRLLRERDAFTPARALVDRNKCPESKQAAVTFQKTWLFFLISFVSLFLNLALKFVGDLKRRKDRDAAGEGQGGRELKPDEISAITIEDGSQWWRESAEEFSDDGSVIWKPKRVWKPKRKPVFLRLLEVCRKRENESRGRADCIFEVVDQAR